MKVTVIPADRWIKRDAEEANLPNWPFTDADIHAIQWDDQSGEIEFDGSPKPANQVFTDFAILQPYLDALDAHKAAQAAAAANAPKPEPAPILTTEQKLEAAGLTVAELKELFGLN